MLLLDLVPKGLVSFFLDGEFLASYFGDGDPEEEAAPRGTKGRKPAWRKLSAPPWESPRAAPKDDDFGSLQRALEMDPEWHRMVASSTPATILDMSGDLCSGGRPVPVPPLTSPAVAPATRRYYGGRNGSGGVGSGSGQGGRRPCCHCGLVVEDQIRHFINHCDRFKDQGRYQWRKGNVLHYLDSLMDHNKFRIFCDLPDRKTSSGAIVPDDILPPTHSLFLPQNLLYLPAMVAIGREEDEVFVFSLCTPDDSDPANGGLLRHSWAQEDFQPLLDAVRAQMGATTNVSYYSIAVGSSLGHMSESTKFALWQLFQLTTQSLPVETMIRNVSALVKLSSYKIFKTRYEARWDKRTKVLLPADRGRESLRGGLAALANLFYVSVFGPCSQRRKATVRLKRRRGLIRGCLVPLLKLLVAMALAGFALSSLYCLSLLMTWLWSMVTLKATAVGFFVLLGWCLKQFRP